jgi:hypothetical protein
MGNRLFAAHVTHSPEATVTMVNQRHWQLEIPALTTRTYRLAQLDDHGGLPREQFAWKPPVSLNLQARISGENLPGTWGFGFWNDPFSFLIGGDRAVRRFPTLPDAAWFFHASQHNYLSFRDDLPASGFLAATFSSRKVPAALLALGSPALGLTLLPYTAQLVRKSLRSLVRQDASLLHIDETQWHTYTLVWQPSQVSYSLDGEEIWQTTVTPSAPLSLVIWIDNQYAALPPKSRLRYGSLPNPSPAWLEVRDIELQEHR